ncbi:tetratricopeptide repeat protein [Synechocystis sp. PCC 7509]|uniref:tetratricopeptide repeat protein n=1 Tax=Synechocystis sp. PCC 7509 TaxID=927677 RepID=UPI0002ACEFCD|nr:tetratricopeptide repeat protein [Synechocystis sp. PCC 7509]
MRLKRQLDTQIITIDPTSSLGHGGEAKVYSVPQDETLVAKVYHKPTEAHANKLMLMLANPPDNPAASKDHISIAWPVDVLRTIDEKQKVVGFLMTRVKEMHSLLDFYNPKTRRQKCPFFNYLYLHRTARNLAAAFGALHARGYCIGDVNESNILVSNTALITLVDTDSFQVRNERNGEIYRCAVGKPEFTPPELQGQSFAQLDRAPEHDLFGLAVLIFQLLMEGTHPFAGIYQGSGDAPPYETRIAEGHFVYSRRRVPYLPTIISPKFELLHPILQQLFIRCFEEGHNNPQMRPTAQIWQSALSEAERDLTTCKVNSHHRHGKHLSYCPWCERTFKLSGRDPFPSSQTVQKGQHLLPLKKRNPTLVLPKSQPVSSFYRQNLLSTSPRQYRHKQKINAAMLSAVGVGAVGLFGLTLIVKDFKLSSKISETLFPPAEVVTSNQTADVNKIASKYNHQGKISSKYEDYDGAIENFNQALIHNPNDAQAYIDRGNALYENAQNSGNPDEEYKIALKDFDNALKLNPNEAEAYISRGTVRYDIAEYSPDAIDEYKAAIADFNQAISKNPTNALAYVKRGITQQKLAKKNSGDLNQGYQKALKDFDLALQLDPKLAEAYVEKGNILYELAKINGKNESDYWGAIANLQTAAKIFLDRQDMERYQEALDTLGNICLAIENDCQSLLTNPQLPSIAKPQPINKNKS